MRDAVIDEITVRGRAQPPAVVVNLIRGAFVQEPEVQIMRMFHSHAGIEHLRADWNNHPLLLFADMEATDYASVWQYQLAKAFTTLRQNVTMGLKKGNTVLLHFQYQGHFYQAILMMAGSVPGSKGGVDTHKLWKHVIPRSTEFAWLPSELAEAFGLPALKLDPNRHYSCRPCLSAEVGPHSAEQRQSFPAYLSNGHWCQIP